MDPYRKKALITGVASLLLCAVSFSLIFFLRPPYGWRGASDASFMAAAIGLAFCGMSFVVRSGTFDVLNYGVYRLFESFRLDRKKKWDNAGDYKEDRQKKRQLSKAVYWPSLASAGLFLALAIAFLIVFYAAGAK